jgi:hypothetical protein
MADANVALLPASSLRPGSIQRDALFTFDPRWFQWLAGLGHGNHRRLFTTV